MCILLPSLQITYVHGDVPGHVDVRFVFIHPHLGGPQCVALGVVIYVVVVGLLGSLDVSHSGAGKDLHTASTLPHLQEQRESPLHVDSHRNVALYCYLEDGMEILRLFLQ